MKTTRIAVLVSGSGSNLQALIDAGQIGGLGDGRLELVLSSQPQAYALKRAYLSGIPSMVVNRKEYDSRESFTRRITHELKTRDIGLVVLAGFMYVLSEGFCDAFSGRVVNVHPALIPAFCGEGFYGLRVHKAVLDYGVKLTGATVHFVTPEPDGGPIILQKAVPVEPDDTPESLQRRVMEQAEWILLPEAVRLFCEGRLRINGHRVTIVGRG